MSVLGANVFNLAGPEFLKLYGGLLAGAVAVLLVLRYLLRGPGGEPAVGADNLAPLETAFLTGGRRGTVDAAVASLVQRGLLKVKLDGNRPKLRTLHPMPIELNEVERAVYLAVAETHKNDALLGPVRLAAADAADEVGDTLREHELVLPEARMAVVRFIPVLPLALCLIVGVQKLVFGVNRGKPIGFLVILCFFTLVIGLIALANYPHRTRRGGNLLASLRRRNASMELTSIRQMSPADATMAFALFGPAVLASGADADFHEAMRRNTASGSGCGSSSCGSSSCGGGGGCGGGGCGGCGGGGD